MISGWVVKLVVSLALLGLVLFEAGSPWVARVQLDGAAVEAARQANRRYDRTKSVKEAEAAAQEVAAEDGATVSDFEITREADETGVRLRVNRRAPSVVVGKWDKTSGYYDVSVVAESGGEL